MVGKYPIFAHQMPVFIGEIRASGCIKVKLAQVYSGSERHVISNTCLNGRILAHCVLDTLSEADVTCFIQWSLLRYAKGIAALSTTSPLQYPDKYLGRRFSRFEASGPNISYPR